MASRAAPDGPSRLLLNHRTERMPASARPGPHVRAFHRRLPGYAPTPLRDMPALAAACGVGRVLVKDETSRLGLPSFKPLGASWAVYRLLCERLAEAGATVTPHITGAPDHNPPRHEPGGEAESPGTAAGPAGEGTGGPAGSPGTAVGAGTAAGAGGAVGAGGAGGAEATGGPPSSGPASSEPPAEPRWETLDDLAALVAAGLGPLRLVAATDGNHGRAVAQVARLLDLDATILVPMGTATARIAGIESEGADVVVVPGSYDDAVAEAAALGDDRTLVVSDTAWPGYDGPPRWVIEGYSTIFAEVDAQLGDVGAHGLDLAVVPVGVGALAAAAGDCLRPGIEPGDGPVLVGVEPADSACVAAAVRAGHVVEVPGPHRSVMAGLNCGIASLVALPTLMAAFDAFVAVGNDRARGALRALAGAGLDVGETGAAALAGLTAAIDDHRAELPVPSDAVVLLLATEGVTDPAGFERVVGRPPH